MAEFRDKVEFEDVFVEKETAHAILAIIDDEKHWIPKSQIDDDSEVFELGDKGTLIVSEWIAEQKGLV